MIPACKLTLATPSSARTASPTTVWSGKANGRRPVRHSAPVECNPNISQSTAAKSAIISTQRLANESNRRRQLPSNCPSCHKNLNPAAHPRTARLPPSLLSRTTGPFRWTWIPLLPHSFLRTFSCVHFLLLSRVRKAFCLFRLLPNTFLPTMPQVLYNLGPPAHRSRQACSCSPTVSCASSCRGNN
jgi:hypothetical protein